MLRCSIRTKYIIAAYFVYVQMKHRSKHIIAAILVYAQMQHRSHHVITSFFVYTQMQHNVYIHHRNIFICSDTAKVFL